MKLLTRAFVRGLLAIIPITVTIYILWWAATGAEALLGPILKRWLPETFYFPGLGVLAGLLIVLALGLLLQVWFVRGIFRVVERVLDRIPLVKTLYGSVRDLMGFFGRSGSQDMGQVVTVTLGDGGPQLLGFLTRESLDDLPAGLRGEGQVAVYLPMSYQIGGYTLILPRSAVTPVEMGIEDAMRFAVTAGVKAKAGTG